MASEISLEKIWQRYKDLSFASESTAGALEISEKEIEKLQKEVKNLEDIKTKTSEALESKKSYRISKVLEIFIAGALATSASDIHLEPEENSVRLRLRLDGVLEEVLTLDLHIYALLLSRLKLLSGMKLNVRDSAQDGRFSIKAGGTDIEIRSSVLPGAYSESIVMRILNPKSISVPLEELGIDETLLKVLSEEISKPEGMILTTGPTGSGKTTTLYAFLKKIHTPEIKIITIEDPIEYHLPGIVQTQVETEKGYSFHSGLRAALRQDPDVIMVGEIRDNETAKTAIDAAETGHLVFSTLHTNSAAGVFPRLIGLGANPKIFSSAIRLAMAQRLVRKLCEKCKKAVLLEGEIKKLAENVVRKTGRKEIQTKEMFTAKGCAACHNTGYKGRTGIYEAMKPDAKVEAVILQNPSEREINKAAEGQGILTMREDGILKILSGITSLEELKRVIDIEDK